MAKLFFGAENCKAATSALTGRRYNADRQGFIHVSDPADAKYLKDGGYIEAGGMPRLPNTLNVNVAGKPQYGIARSVIATI